MLKKVDFYKPVYTVNIPREIEQGNIYISKEFETALHLCACGCGNPAVTPFNKPYGWDLKEGNGEISLSPSILNTGCPNKAHYYITNNKVIWC